MTTKWFKQASRKADARKVELLEMPFSHLAFSHEACHVTT
jgi:hypothetical protein